jgi:low affinity Fe/Cu permease
VHIKLNELVAAMKGASNRVVDVEAFTESELRTIERYYAELARLAREEVDLTRSHSIEEAREQHTVKHRKRGGP